VVGDVLAADDVPDVVPAGVVVPGVPDPREPALLDCDAPPPEACAGIVAVGGGAADDALGGVSPEMVLAGWLVTLAGTGSADVSEGTGAANEPDMPVNLKAAVRPRINGAGWEVCT
jgi:hypothetical protein